MKTHQLTIEGLTFTVAPTPLVYMADPLEVWRTKGARSKEGLQALVEALFHGIRRAKRLDEKSGGITLDFLTDNIDGHNADEIFRIFAELNQLVPKADGGPATGEAQPGSH